MGTTRYEELYFDIEVRESFVIVRRTTEAFDVQSDLFKACLPVFELLRARRHLGLVIDLRGNVGRAGNFESEIKNVRLELMKDHPCVAIIVETAVGRLQLNRQIREDQHEQIQQVFQSESAAYLFAGTQGV